MKLLLIMLLLISCAKESNYATKTVDGFEVSLLFEYEGCKVYRFIDVGRNIHFTNCTETMTQVSCGKNCTRPINVKGSR